MVLGAIVHVSLIVVLLHWKPNPDNPYVFYSVSGLWGVGDAVWQTQVNGTYCELIYFINKFSFYLEFLILEIISS